MSNANFDKVTKSPRIHIDKTVSGEDIANLALPSGFDTLVCVSGESFADDESGSDLYHVGLCSNIVLNSRRPITQAPELGSNFTFVLTDAAQNSVTMSRLMPVRLRDGKLIGNLPYEILSHSGDTKDYFSNVSGGNCDKLMAVDLDWPVFDYPATIYLLTLRDDETGTRVLKSKIRIKDCMFAQYGFEVVAGRKNIPENAVLVCGDIDELMSEIINNTGSTK